ncbi:RagB/SusD family nutrient uptake outer membrane protein [Carboxylicivirga taeanensis]|uniref:RagB/SusD family nutrient uptake outer membrane protein n=1 Tax=Carboxylicivirga taeanensis TaxID=1416875 RepID=UPI003F6DB42C
MKKYIIILISLISFVSCEKDLDLFPKDQLSDGSFWKTEKDFQLAANDLYSALLAPGYYDNSSDISFGQNGNSRSNGSYLAPPTSSLWNDSYSEIRGVNYIIQKGAEFESDNGIQRYVGEALFFRAYHYFNLVREFGDVPLITNVLDINSEELFGGRTSRAEVIKLVLNDLELASSKLPKHGELPASEIGRITEGTALALKSRVALFEGTWQKFHNGSAATEYLTSAADAAKRVIDSKQYDVYTAYADSSYRMLFIDEGEDCNEVILARRYNKKLQITHNYTRWLDLGVYDPTKSMVDSYLFTDGLPMNKTSLFEGYATMTSEFANRDPRLELSVFKPGTFYVSADTEGPRYPMFEGNGATKTGYMIRKFRSSDKDALLGQANYDYINIRYGEVLLNYAEALFELNGEISDAELDLSINKLRARVKMPRLTNAFVANNDLDMREEIRRERKVELAFEGFRFWDLMRWKVAESVLPKAMLGVKFEGTEYQEKNPTVAIGSTIFVNHEGFIIAEPAANRNFDPQKNYLRSIPLQEISKNPNLLPNNPGWE